MCGILGLVYELAKCGLQVAWHLVIDSDKGERGGGKKEDFFLSLCRSLRFLSLLSRSMVSRKVSSSASISLDLE